MNIDKSFIEIKLMIDQARYDAYKKVNTELVTLYWNIGAYINSKLSTSKWGEKTVTQLSEYLTSLGAEYKSFNSRSLYRMNQFYQTYKDSTIVSPLVTQLAWSNHLLILSKTKTPEEKEFYIRLAIKENYSKRELERQLDSAIYERTMLSDHSKLPVLHVTNEKIVLRDSYVFEFLDLHDDHSERDLKKSLVKHLRHFLLEIGKDFTFIGEEYRVQVGMTDYYIDLLFFHRDLKCLVAFELKITDFKPEYLGQLNFYLEALDRDIKKKHENPSIGILLCKNKDKEIVEYAMSRNMVPAMVAEYNLKLPDKNILREKLHNLFNELPRIDEDKK